MGFRNGMPFPCPNWQALGGMTAGGNPDVGMAETQRRCGFPDFPRTSFAKGASFGRIGADS